MWRLESQGAEEEEGVPGGPRKSLNMLMPALNFQSLNTLFLTL